MKNWFNDDKLQRALVVLQVLCIMVLFFGTVVALFMGSAGAYLAYTALTALLWLPALASLLGIVCVVLVSVCSYRAVLSFFRMCGRLKHERAFTAQNERALQIIMRMSYTSAVALMVLPLSAIMLVYVVAGGVIWVESFSLLFLWPPMVLVELLAFMYAGVGLVVHVLRDMLHRGQAIQDEYDLTV